MTFEEWWDIHLRSGCVGLERKSIGKAAWDHQQETIEKLNRQYQSIFDSRKQEREKFSEERDRLLEVIREKRDE